ncbi:MAG: DUF4349 domain-containing protein [Clostridia bacterium]|nr:DUF4349 domain-containing protein [Clostridia bacterium]
MMDCRTFALLPDTPETEWTAAQRAEMEAHAATCPDCAALLALKREMRAMDEEVTVPETLSASWRKAIREEDQKKMSKIKTFPWKRALAYAAAFVVVAIGTASVYNNSDWGKGGVSANSTAQRSALYEDGYTADYDAGNAAAASGAMLKMTADMAEPTLEYAEEEAADGSKIIRNVNLTVRTQEYEKDYEAIRQLVAEAGGRIESLSMSGDGTAYSLRRANFTLRIPSNVLDDFVNGARKVGSVSAYSESSEDVSASYYDTQTRLETQRAKLQRLTELMEKAEDVSDLIEIEGAISDAQYWIDYYTGQLKSYDSRVNDSYVYLTLREISSASAADNKELTLGERIVNAVKASLETAGEVLLSLVIFLIAALPWLLALAAVILVIRVIVRRRRNKRKEKAE